MHPSGLNWAEVNNGQWSFIWCLAKGFSAMCWLSWLNYLVLVILPAGEPFPYPLVAAQGAAAVSTLQRQSRAGGWQCQCADPGLNRHGNSITLGGGPCSAGRGSFSCWGCSRKEAAAALAELSPVGGHLLTFWYCRGNKWGEELPGCTWNRLKLLQTWNHSC